MLFVGLGGKAQGLDPARSERQATLAQKWRPGRATAVGTRPRREATARHRACPWSDTSVHSVQEPWAPSVQGRARQASADVYGVALASSMFWYLGATKGVTVAMDVTVCVYPEGRAGDLSCPSIRHRLSQFLLVTEGRRDRQQSPSMRLDFGVCTVCLGGYGYDQSVVCLATSRKHRDTSAHACLGRDNRGPPRIADCSDHRRGGVRHQY